MNREIHVRAWESLGGQFPRATRQASNRCIEDPALIERIQAHLNDKAPSAASSTRRPRLGVPDSSTESRMLSSLLLLLFWRRRACYWLDAENWAESG
jgi:hypothetical protein